VDVREKRSESEEEMVLVKVTTLQEVLKDKKREVDTLQKLLLNEDKLLFSEDFQNVKDSKDISNLVILFNLST
jgi:hypothetical protein